MIVLAVVACVVVAVTGAPQNTGGSQGLAQPPQAPFQAGYTPEVLQARNNFHQAYNYLAELAHLAPDDVPATPAAPGAVGQATTAAQTPTAATPVPLPPGYQFGGLTPEVAQATSDFFRQYVAAANRAGVPAAAGGNQVA